MPSKEYLHYIKSPEWYSLKADLLQLRGAKCERCGRKGKPTSLHIHHITYERLFVELPSDLLILCPKCHRNEHGLDKNGRKVKTAKKRSTVSKKKKSNVSNVARKAAAGKYATYADYSRAITSARKRDRKTG